jgi:glutathione S-transferase
MANAEQWGVKGPFAFGTTLSMADCCLVPQVYAARRFGVDLAPFPRLRSLRAACEAVPAFADAHPARQPDSEP